MKNLLSQNVDCVENKRVKCERKNLFILRCQLMAKLKYGDMDSE